jgi:phenylalanyl-tRNA synthetase beta chain
MRKNLLYGGLEAIAYNINRRNADLKLYEFGYCYYQDSEFNGDEPLSKFDEQLHMSILLSGKSQPGNWVQAAEESSFFVLKNYLETVLVKMGIDPRTLESATHDHPDFSEHMAYSFQGLLLVGFGSVDPALLREFEIKQAVYAAEFNWDNVMTILAGHRIRYKSLPRFQVVTRDFSLMLDRKVTFESLRVLAFMTEKKLLKEVSLFDVYEGDKIEKGKKSYALTFTLLDEEKTLTDKQIDKVMLNLARAFERELGAVVRGMN